MKTFSFIRMKRNIPLELESTDRRHEEQALGEERPRSVEEPVAGALVFGAHCLIPPRARFGLVSLIQSRSS